MGGGLLPNGIFLAHSVVGLDVLSKFFGVGVLVGDLSTGDSGFGGSGGEDEA